MAFTAVILSGAGTTAAIAATSATTLFGAFAGSVLGNMVISTVIGAALSALSPKPSFSASTTKTGVNRGYQLNSVGPAQDHAIIYGAVKVGGAIVYSESTGAENKYFHRVIAMAGHEVSSFETIYIDDEIATLDSNGNVTSPSRFSGKVRIRTHLGSPDQTADTALVSESAKWTSAHRLRGIAYIYAKFTFDRDAFPNGVPTITATVKGKKLFDPRTGVSSWSDNPALCNRDYLVSKYGLKEQAANIDDALVITSANICDQTNTEAGTARYTCNGSFTTSSTPYDTISSLLTSMGGSSWYAQGKWRMKAAYYTAPVMDLNEDDLRSNVGVSTRHSRRDNYNVIKGTFRGEESNWQTTDYPQVTNVVFLSADNNQESVADVDLGFTDNSIEARRLGLISLERNRQQLTVNASFGLRAMALQVGDNVRISNSRFGWTHKEFEVLQWTFGLTGELDLQVQMILRETAESVFDEIDDGIVYERDNTNLPSAFDVASVGISLVASLRETNQTVVAVLGITLDTSSVFVDRYEVEYKLSEDTLFTSLASGSNNKFELIYTSDSDFDIRARAINTFGVRGAWTTTTNFSARPFEPNPQDVSSLSINVTGTTAVLSWFPVPDLDLSHYEIRFTRDTVAPVWSNSVLLIDRVARPATSVSLPTQVGTFLIKAVDKLGNKSDNAVGNTVIISADDILGLNLVHTYVQDPNFTGTKDNTIVTDDYLTLGSSTTFDSVSGDFDDKEGNFDKPDGSLIYTTGSYNFPEITDLGAKFTSYVESSIKISQLDFVNTFDAASGNFDIREGLFDGDTSAYDSSSAKVQVATTLDDPNDNPTWTDWSDLSAGSFLARGYKFRAVLSTSSQDVAPKVEQLKVSIDMPDRTDAVSNINFTGTKAVVYPKAFYAASAPSLGITLTGLGGGDYYEITNKSHTGFTITTKDNTGTTLITETQLDYVAHGYGKEIT